MLEHVQILKLAEEEAEVVGAVDKLGVPEVLVTYGERGSLVYLTAGARRSERGRSPPTRPGPVTLSRPRTSPADRGSRAHVCGAPGERPSSAPC